LKFGHLAPMVRNADRIAHFEASDICCMTLSSARDISSSSFEIFGIQGDL